jgi:hypothetical protein
VDFTQQRVASGLQLGTGVALVGATVFVGGYADQTVFDGSPGSFGGDGVVLRYDTNGTWQATSRIGSNTEDFVAALASNASNLLVAGYTDGSFDGQTNAGRRDAFLSKRDSAGTAIWTRLVGTNDYEDAGGAAFDSAGNAYLAGVTQGSFPSFNNPNFAANAFVARFDSAGNRTLLQQFVASPGTGSQAYDVGVDPSGNIYLAGSAYGSFGGQMNAGLWDAFLMKLDSAGNMLWARLLGTSGDDAAGTLDFDGMGHIWIAGNSKPVFGPNVRNSDGFVAEYDADGNLLGKVSIATSADESIGLTMGPDGAAYVTGYARSLDSFGDPIIGSSDIIVAKIVPEPCTALLGVSGVMLLLLRRRS